jgi:hypothetical protein
MVNSISATDFGAVAFKSRVDCNTSRHPRWLVGDMKRGICLACTVMDFLLPFHPNGYFRALGRTSCDVLRGIRVRVKLIRIAGPSGGGYIVINLSM